MLRLVCVATLLLSVAANFNITNGTGVGQSDGCTTIENSKDAGEKITKVTYKWVSRGAVCHTGLEVETKKGTYRLAYNSKSIPSTLNTDGNVWCETGKMPMKNSLANGNCGGCGGWQSGGSHSGSMKSLKDFMGDVKSYADSKPYYNLLACTLGGKTANCQVVAAHLYKKLAGSYPSKGSCPECPSACDK